MTYFLFTDDMLFSEIFFFRIADVCVFAKTTGLFDYVFIQDKSVRVHEICDQSDLAILNGTYGPKFFEFLTARLKSDLIIQYTYMKVMACY